VAWGSDIVRKKQMNDEPSAQIEREILGWRLQEEG
jgi:hypothetical protein